MRGGAELQLEVCRADASLAARGRELLARYGGASTPIGGFTSGGLTPREIKFDQSIKQISSALSFRCSPTEAIVWQLQFLCTREKGRPTTFVLIILEQNSFAR